MPTRRAKYNHTRLFKVLFGELRLLRILIRVVLHREFPVRLPAGRGDRGSEKEELEHVTGA